MSQILETDFIDFKSLRDENLSRVDVLDRVGTLALMPGTEFASSKQITSFYQVPASTIRTLVAENKDELIEAGYTHMKGKEIVCLVNGQAKVEQKRGCVLIDGDSFSVGLNALFPRRAILLVGMLLRDSEVAKQVRTYLLDVEQIAQEVAPGVIEMAVGVMDCERELKADLAEAILNGDVIAAAEIMKRINQFTTDVSQRRVVELTEENAALVLDNQNLMAQYEVCAEEREELDSKLNFMCSRTHKLAERRALCLSIIEAYGESQFGNEQAGYNSVYETLKRDYSINLISRKVPTSKKALIDYLTYPEFMLLEMLLRKLVVTFDLKVFYND